MLVLLANSFNKYLDISLNNWGLKSYATWNISSNQKCEIPKKYSALIETKTLQNLEELYQDSSRSYYLTRWEAMRSTFARINTILSMILQQGAGRLAH